MNTQAVRAGLRLFQAEWFKYRRTSVLWLVMLIPLLTAAAGTAYVVPRHESGLPAWMDAADTVIQIWSGVWLPYGAGFIAALSAHLEESGDTWRILRSRHVPPAGLFVAKLIVLALLMLISTLGLVILLGVTNAFFFRAPYVEALMLVAAPLLLSWYASLPILIASYWIAEAFGWAVPIGMGFLGLLVAALIGGTKLGDDVWPYMPWAWPIRLAYAATVCLMPPSSSLSEAAAWLSQHRLIVIAVLAGSLFLSIFFAGGGAVWFSRRER